MAIPRPEDFHSDYGDSPAPTIANVDSVVIIDNGEPLVTINHLRFLPLPKGCDLLVREGVAHRLNRAAEFLNARGEKLYVIQAWRPRVESPIFHRIASALIRIGERDWPAESVREAAHKFFNAETFAPPATTTGGAVVVAKDLLSKMQKTNQWLSNIPGLPADEIPLSNSQDAISVAMRNAGFVRDPWDKQLWCYGTSAWALAKGEPCAIYGRVETRG